MAKKHKQTNPRRIALTKIRRARKASRRQSASRRARIRSEQEERFAQSLLRLSREAGETVADEPSPIVDSHLRNCQPEAVRQFYGGALKFLIPRDNWNDDPPETRVDSHRKVKPIRQGFQWWNEATFNDAKFQYRGILEAMRQAARRNPGAKLPARQARELLTRLRRDMVKRCREYIKEHRPAAGLLLYDITVKREYYPRGAAGSGDRRIDRALGEL